MSHPAPESEVVLHHDSPSLLGGEEDPVAAKVFVNQAMLENQPRLDSNFSVAADRARMAAPGLEDQAEWEGLMVALMDGVDNEWGELRSPRPTPVGYVYVLRFRLDSLVIAATDDLDKGSHLAFRVANPHVDLLWFPSLEQGPPNNAIRVITHRDLLEHFEVIKATPIEGWSRPPQES